MGKQRTFKVGDTTYDVPEDKAKGFLSRKPDAIEVSSFIVDKDTFDVPLDKVEGFLSRKPNAKPLGEPVAVAAPAQSQEIPTITLDQAQVEGELNEEGLTKEEAAQIYNSSPTGPLKPSSGGFQIGKQWQGDASKIPTLTKQTKDVFVKKFLELPDNLKLDARNSGVFVNTFAKKMNLSPRELRQVANETVKTEVHLKQLKTIYDQNPDDTDTLYKLAELHNNLGQHDLAYEAYAALEGKLKTIGEKEASDPNNPNKRPDYVEQRQLPAVAGMAYTQELLGNKAEAQRLKGISESKGYKGQEFSSVGAGEALQPGNDMVYNDQGQMIPVGSPTPESEYLNGIAQAIENFTLFGPANEMTNVGFDKLAKNLPGAFDPYGLPLDKIAKTVGVITGAVETLMGVAGMTTPAGALFAMPLVQAQNIAPELAKWMMPLGVVLNEYYRQQGEKMPEMMENVTVLADLGLLGFLTHQGVEGAKGLKAEIDLKKVFENLPPEAVEQLAKVGEKRIEMAQGDPKVYGEQMALRLDELKPQVEEIKMQAEAAKPVEPYNPPPHPQSLRTVEEGSSVVMNGEEGILERGDDGTWYFTTDSKSTQIKVADKFNPSETLKELGIEVLAEITPEQVARATADAEQVGRVQVNGKEYFVSLDRVGNENPTGDFVLEVKPDGTMINRFDSHPDPTFAKERKQKIINEFLKKNNKPPRKALTEVKEKVETVIEAKPVEAEVAKTPEPIKVEVQESLKDVESTAKALNDADKLNKLLDPTIIGKDAYENAPTSEAYKQKRKDAAKKEAGKDSLPGDETDIARKALLKEHLKELHKERSEYLADAYHKAKADGSNPKLVKAVEETLYPSEVKLLGSSDIVIEGRKIEGRFLNEEQSAELQKEIEDNYNVSPENMFGGKNNDIRKSLYNYENPWGQATINGVNIRIAQGLTRGLEGNRRATWLVYADGKIVGEFYSNKDAKLVISKMKDSLIKELSGRSASSSKLKASPKEILPANEPVSPAVEVQIEDFGVPKSDVGAVKSLLDNVFAGLKKAGLTAFKTLDEWIGIGKGEAKEYSLKINGKEVKVKNTGVDVVNGFYSPLEKTISETKFDKLPTKQWIEKFGKGEEAKWTGLTEWLSQQEGTVSKADIQKFLKDNRIEIVEVVKGDFSSVNDAKKEFEKSGYELQADVFTDSEGRDFIHEDEVFYLDKDGEFVEYDDLPDNLKRTVDGLSKQADNTKFSQYQESGEKENYKEVLVTLPDMGDKNRKEVLTKQHEKTLEEVGEALKPLDAKAQELYGQRYSNLNHNEKLEVQFAFYQKSDVYFKYQKAVEKMVNAEKALKAELNGDKQFKSTHFDEPNILVHLRMNTRTDAQGNKVLFLEEVQSDWGQRGKKEGFEGTQEVKDAIKKRDEIIASYKKLYPIEWDAMRAAAADQRVRDLDKIIGGTKTPTAPFVTDTNAWTKLGLKVALKEAVKQGADKIAWTSGEQQNDRYDLSKVYNSIRITPESISDKYGRSEYSGNFNIEGVLADGDRYIDIKEGVSPKELENYVGKEIAEKAINGKEDFDGVDLKVGGKGMKGFYGSPTEGSLGIVGNVAKSLFKQEPKTVEIDANERGKRTKDFDGLQESLQFEKQLADKGKTGIVSTVNKDGSYTIEWNENKPSTQHSIDITPELKASVEGGQSLFKGSQAQYHIQSGKNIIEAIKNFNGSKKATVAITHEIMHPTVVAIIDGAKSGVEKGIKHTDTIVSEYNKAKGKKITAQELIEGNDAFKEGETSDTYRAVQEFIADSWEKYHREGGKGFSEAFQKVLEQITQAFTDVYKTLKGKELTPELRKMFDEILGKEPEPVKVKEPRVESEVETKVRELKPQLEVTPESIEIEAPDVESEFRKEPSEGNIGNDVDVRFADNVTIGAKYKLIEADDLQASHYTSGARNEKHGISQAQPKERNDLGSKAQQDKIAANPKFELVSEDNAAYSGAPIVNSRGEVIQGNNRSIGLKKHYQGGGTKYKGDLAANAEKYGFTKEQVEGMKNPVLVREITAQDNMAVRLGQFKATDLETGGKTRIDPITTSRKMSSQERGVLARLLVEGDYNSIKDAIRDNQKEIMKVLKKHLSPSEIKSMLKPGEDSFSATGMDDVAQVFSNLLFEGGDAVLPEIWDNLPARTRKNLEKALPEILETAQEKSILPAVQNVMMALHEWANSGIENFGEWKSQVDMFKGVKPDDIFTPFEMALGEKLANAKTQGEAKAIFQEYNELVSGTKETLFEQATEGKSMSDAVKELFNVELNEKDTQLQGERGVKATIPQEKPKTTTKTSKPQATGEGELTAEAKPDTKPVEADTPLKITSKEKALKAVDDLESFLLNLPGIKDNVGGERMGAPFKMEDAVKFFAEALREGVEQGYKVKDAIERAIGKLKEHKTYKALLDSVDESMLRNNAKKNYEKQGVSLDKPIEQQFGASHASVAEVRKVMGLTDEINITDAHKRDTKTVMKEGKQIAESSNVQFLADDIISGEKIPNAQEQAALVYEQTKLYNESLDYQDRIDSFTEKGELNAADQATIELANIRARQRNVMDALDIAGTKMGLAFRMRQLINKRDYSLVALEKRWTSASGGNEITPSVRKQLEARVKELEAEVKKSEELFKAKDKELADQAMLDIQEALAREKTSPLQRIKAEKKIRKEELAQKFRGVFNDATNIAKAMVDKEFYEYARLVLEEAVGDFKEFSKRMIGDLGKNVEPHLQEIFDKASKKEYEKAFVDEVKGIQIDKQLIRDIVEQGVKDSQELVDKVFDAVKDDLPEGTSRREVQDAISEYGKQINPKIDPLQAEINSLKRDLKLESGLEDATSGKGVKRSGFTQPKPTAKQRSLKRRINEELKNYPQDQAEVNKKWATALDRTKTALNNSITDLTKRLDDLKQGIATAKNPKERLKLDADAQALKDMRNDLVKQIEEIEGKKKLSYEQRVILAIEAAERTAQKYKNRTEEIKKTGTYSKDTPLQLSSPELDIARAKRDAAQAEFDQASKDANLDVIAATSKALRDSQDRVAKLEQKVRSNDISYAQRAVRLAIETPELKASKAAEKALRDIIDTMREEQGVAELHRMELWKNRAANRLKELERRVREKDYSKKVKKETPIDIEMERTAMKIDRAKFDLDVAIEVERYKNLQGWEKVGETVSDIFNIPKSIMASMDISAPFRQGAVLFARHPILGVKATKEMFKHLWSEKEANAWNDRLRLSDGYIRAKKSNLFISEPMARLVASEERFMSHMAEKIPVIGRGIKASNRAYSGFLNKIRTDVFNQHYEALVNEGFSGKELQSELSQMAHLINNFSGRGKLGKRGELASPLLNAAFFAPRYVTSRINTLANAVTGYWLEGRAYGSQRMSTRTRIEAYKALGAYVTVGVGVLQMAKAAGAEVEIDPRSSDFGKIKIGDLRYDIWAGFQQEIVLLARIFTQAKVDVFNGKVKKFNEGFGSSNTGSTVGNFLRSKASPQVGYALSAMTGTTMGIEEFDAGKELLRMSVPLLLQDPIANLIYNDAVSMYKEGDAGFGTFAAGATGIGVGYIPKPKPVEDANLKERSLNLMIGKQYKPQDYKDDEVYVKGKPYIIPEDKMVKIKEMRAKEAGKLIELHYWKLKKLTPEEYESKVNSYYNEGLKKARNKYLPSGWKNTK